MATRLRKSRRHRGSRYCGWGQIGQHRQSGSRGGIGGGGKHKHFWIRTVIEEPDHFGHDTLNSYSNSLVKKWINLRDLKTLSTKFSNKKDQKNYSRSWIIGNSKTLGRRKYWRKLCYKGSTGIC